MAKNKKKRFQFQLGVPGLIFSLGLLICLFLWMFVLGFYFGQKMMSSRIEKLESPVSKEALTKKKTLPPPPPVFEEVKPPPLVGEKIEKQAPLKAEPPAKPALVAKPAPESKEKETPKARVAKTRVAKVQAKPQTEAKKLAGPFYSVQIASLRSVQEAQKYVRYLRERGYESFMRKVTLPQKGTWYRVYVGRFKSLTEARRFGEELKKREKIKSFYIQKLGASS
jgi:cell division septation protein DedD